MRALALTAIVLVLLAVTAIFGAGRALVVADPLPPTADAIVVLAGSISDRVLEAADLYRAGVAPEVVVTRERLRRGETRLRAAGVQLPDSDELTRTALVQLGVPERSIVRLRRRNTSTMSEARTIARWACHHRLHTLVVVTSRAHSRRARQILAKSLGPGIALSMRPSRYDDFTANRWWRVRHDAKVVLTEWEKYAHYWLSERWIIAPCGGLIPPGARAALPQPFATASRRSGASSPRACISRTMSQPPMNFPPT